MALTEREALDQYLELQRKRAEGKISGREFETGTHWITSQAESTEVVNAIKLRGRKR